MCTKTSKQNNKKKETNMYLGIQKLIPPLMKEEIIVIKQKYHAE